jgi:hypothetical protein
MFEYIFLHKALSEKFTGRLDSLSVPFESRDDELGIVVSIPEDLDEALVERVDELYETFFDESEDLLRGEGQEEKHVAAIDIRLSDGSVTQASIRPELMNKVLGALSFDELNEFVDAIRDSIENPDERPFCQR